MQTQKSKQELAYEPVQCKIQANWSAESASYFTQQLYSYVDKNKISFMLRAKEGSISTNFIITILEGIASAFIYDIIKIIFKLLKKERENNKYKQPVYISTFKDDYIITGDKDSKIPDDLKQELFED